MLVCLPCPLVRPAAHGHLRPQWMRVNDGRVREKPFRSKSLTSLLTIIWSEAAVCIYFTTTSSRRGPSISANVHRPRLIIFPSIHSPKCITSLLRILYMCTYLLLHHTHTHTFVYTARPGRPRCEWRAHAGALYTEIFIMNTLSINKIIEFYIHWVIVVYCLITFVVRFVRKWCMVSYYVQVDYNIHRLVNRIFSEEKSTEVLKIFGQCGIVFLYPIYTLTIKRNYEDRFSSYKILPVIWLAILHYVLKLYCTKFQLLLAIESICKLLM